MRRGPAVLPVGRRAGPDHGAHQHADEPHPIGLLRRQRAPRRAARKCDELASLQLINLHSIPYEAGTRTSIEPNAKSLKSFTLQSQPKMLSDIQALRSS